MALAAYVERTLARVRDTPADPSLLPPNAKRGTIFSGATGVAVFLLEVVRLRGRDDALLARAQEWLDVAEDWARGAGPEKWRRLQRGFVFGDTGIAYVDALLGAAAGERSRAHAAVERIERAAERFDDLDETVRSSGLVAGEAGIVVAARDLLTRLPDSDDCSPTRALLERIRDRRIASLLALHASPLDPRPETLMAMAHGVAGELFVLVTAGHAEHEAVRARLEELALLRQVDPNGLTYWLAERGAVDVRLIESWCNGVTGHTLLWSEVARLTGSDAAKQLAAESARSTAFLMSGGPGLCCGLAGQSIALQRFADLSGDAKYSRYAYARLRRASELAELDRDQGFGFWQGALGVVFVAIAREHGERSFPCTETPRSR
jgi:hypothetical protein